MEDRRHRRKTVLSWSLLVIQRIQSRSSSGLIWFPTPPVTFENGLWGISASCSLVPFKARDSLSVPFALLQSFLPIGSPVLANSDPPEVWVPTARISQEGYQPGFQARSNPTEGLITFPAGSSPPDLPTMFQAGAPMEFSPSELFPPRGAVPVSRYLCLHAVSHDAHLRRFRRHAAAPRLYSPQESDTIQWL